MQWQIFISTFALIFMAELPDKTAFAVLMLSTRGKPWALFAGVALAFLIQSLVAVGFGRLIGLLPQYWVHLGAGMMFLAFAFHSWRSRLTADSAEDGTLDQPVRNRHFGQFWRAFVIIFVAEWGDLTQLATASLAAKSPDALFAVGAGATLALWTATALIILIGTRMKGLLRDDWLKTIAAFAFAGIGIYFVVSA